MHRLVRTLLAKEDAHDIMTSVDETVSALEAAAASIKQLKGMEHSMDVKATLDDLVKHFDAMPPKPPEALPTLKEETKTPKKHNWDSQILTGVDGIWTYHYHICVDCGREGRRKKCSNRKSVICTDEPCTPVGLL